MSVLKRIQKSYNLAEALLLSTLHFVPSFISAIFIGILMRGNTNVNELVLNSNEVTASGATGIIQQLSKSIKVLDISNIVLLDDKSKGEKKAGLRQSQTAGGKLLISY